MIFSANAPESLVHQTHMTGNIHGHGQDPAGLRGLHRVYTSMKAGWNVLHLLHVAKHRRLFGASSNSGGDFGVNRLYTDWNIRPAPNAPSAPSAPILSISQRKKGARHADPFIQRPLQAHSTDFSRFDEGKEAFVRVTRVRAKTLSYRTWRILRRACVVSSSSASIA